MYRTRHRDPSSAGAGPVRRRSIAQRKAARVLPDPVGARIRVWRPAAMAGQPSRWAGVGPLKVLSNQPWVAGEKRSEATSRTLRPGTEARPRPRRPAGGGGPEGAD